MMPRGAKRFGLVAALLVSVAAVLCLGPWYELHAATLYLATLKPMGLILATVLGVLVVRRQAADDVQRRVWLWLTMGLGLSASAQSILAFHQIVLGVSTPFPSPADPLFVIGAFLIIAAMTRFAVQASRSGLPLGSPLKFWAPALVVVAILAVSAPLLLGPVVRAGDPPAELFLNLFYPSASFVTLAPLAVLLRVGLKFRGGRLLQVWLPLILGFGCVLVSDVLFAYLTALDMSGLQPLLDLLYFTGYMLIPTGMAFQRELVAA